MSSDLQNKVDIMPNPRILRTLGEIPFEPWQCFAELIDNSLDAFSYASSSAVPLIKKQIVITWSNEHTVVSERKIEIRDTGPGMTIDSIRNAASAGYSSKSPLNNLGLFGMGFNISTARLGEETLFLSTRSGDSEWVGIRIDFESMIKNEHYVVPVERIRKANVGEQGTRIIIQKLKPGIYDRLRRTSQQIRQTLEDVYSPILTTHNDIEIIIQGNKCKPKPYCVWEPSRYVTRGGEVIYARIDINETVGTALFDIQKNRYLSYEEEEEEKEYYQNNGVYHDGIVEREKRIRGWIGVQRFGDTSLYGIDLVRNGRKILRKDKSFFSYYIDLTGTNKLEYPLELGTSQGGRIVGEIHVDHLVPTYQKNEFDRNDWAWHELVNVLRGSGPISQSTRKELNFEGTNNSPIGKLIKGYNRMDAGTKWLSINNTLAKEWSKKFYSGDPEYQTDHKWFEAAQQADQDRADRGAGRVGPVNPGGNPSDDPGEFAPVVYVSAGGNDHNLNGDGAQGRGGQIREDLHLSTGDRVNDNGNEGPKDEIEDLIERSVKDTHLTREYRYKNCPNPLFVEVRKITSGVIGSGTEGVPIKWEKSQMRSMKFFFNPNHIFFVSRKTTPQDVMLIQLAESFVVRDRLVDKDITSVYMEILDEMFPEEKIDQYTVQEKARFFFDFLRNSARTLLSSRESEVIDLIHEHAGELEDTALKLFTNPDLQRKLQHRLPGAIDAIAAVPERTLVRLVSRFPEEFFDGKLFNVNYQRLELPSREATERGREESKDRIVSYIKDAYYILSPSASFNRQSKDELLRCNHSLELLEEVLID